MGVGDEEHGVTEVVDATMHQKPKHIVSIVLKVIDSQYIMLLYFCFLFKVTINNYLDIYLPRMSTWLPCTIWAESAV